MGYKTELFSVQLFNSQQISLGEKNLLTLQFGKKSKEITLYSEGIKNSSKYK